MHAYNHNAHCLRTDLEEYYVCMHEKLMETKMNTGIDKKNSPTLDERQMKRADHRCEDNAPNENQRKKKGIRK